MFPVETKDGGVQPREPQKQYRTNTFITSKGCIHKINKRENSK